MGYVISLLYGKHLNGFFVIQMETVVFTLISKAFDNVSPIHSSMCVHSPTVTLTLLMFFEFIRQIYRYFREFLLVFSLSRTLLMKQLNLSFFFKVKMSYTQKPFWTTPFKIILYILLISSSPTPILMASVSF